MEITTRNQIKEGMMLYCTRVNSDRSSYVEELVVTELPYKKEYGDNEFFMWCIDVMNAAGKVDQVSITDMGIEQIPQYNLHATFSTKTEAINYEHTVGIDYDDDEKVNTYVELGGDIYSLDEKVDPNEMIPFTFDDCVLALDEMDLDWVMEVGDAAEGILEDLDLYNRLEEDSAYERAMKIV